MQKRTKEYCKTPKGKQKKYEYNTRCKQKVKIEVLSRYSNGTPRCSCCGESHEEFLSIDHINGDGAKHRRIIGRGGVKLYRWLKKNEFPEGYRVLCMNCNWAIGIHGYCPHNKS
ncbi:MAG: hypothetical protein Q8P40_08545 [Nitrospirota bacterium]|nr:hypothetical protein [Nitrospirota bacterium]